MWLGDNIIKVPSVKCKYASLVQTHVRVHTDPRGAGVSQRLLSKLRKCLLFGGAKQIRIRADVTLKDTLGTEAGGVGSGAEKRVPQKQKTRSRACCLGFAKLFAWRKTCILVACAFMHLSSLSLLCLEG